MRRAGSDPSDPRWERKFWLAMSAVCRSAERARRGFHRNAAAPSLRRTALIRASTSRSSSEGQSPATEAQGIPSAKIVTAARKTPAEMLEKTFPIAEESFGRPGRIIEGIL
jgi:hypothetical protein